jgi:hypothetical protein
MHVITLTSTYKTLQVFRVPTKSDAEVAPRHINSHDLHVRNIDGELNQTGGETSNEIIPIAGETV